MIALISCILLYSFVSYSQEKNYSTHGSQIQLEILGPGSLISIHFDTRFSKTTKRAGYRIGLGATPYGLLEKSCNSGIVLTLPAGLYYLAGKQNHLLEIGAGGVLAIGGGTKVYCIELENNFFEDAGSYL